MFEVFREAVEYEWPLEMPIWSVNDGRNTEVWTLDDTTRGVVDLGETGSGKSTGSAMTIAQSYLSQQFGGLVLTTKPGEAKEWSLLCSAMGREDNFKWLRIDGPLKINLLDYETQRPGAGAQVTENVVAFLRALLSVMGNQTGRRYNEGFWEEAGSQILSNLFEVFRGAKVPLNLDVLARFITHAPTEEPRTPEEWRSRPVFGEIFSVAEANARMPEDVRVLENLKEYWLHDYPRLNANTRSCISFGFKAMVNALRSRHIYDLICTNTTVTPEAIFNGAILVLDLPVLEFRTAGVLVQSAIKYLFQRAVERRQNLGNLTRPCFLWEDEGQHFFSEYDPIFQQTARSSRVARVLISQNLNNFYAHLGGGDRAKHLVDSLIGNLTTKIFHRNGDLLTNDYASKLFGTWEKPKTSFSASTAPQTSLNLLWSKPPGLNYTQGWQREPLVPPEEFTRLGLGEAYVYRGGARFKQTGGPFLKAVFPMTRYVEETKAEKGD